MKGTPAPDSRRGRSSHCRRDGHRAYHQFEVGKRNAARHRVQNPRDVIPASRHSRRASPANGLCSARRSERLVQSPGGNGLFDIKARIVDRPARRASSSASGRRPTSRFFAFRRDLDLRAEPRAAQVPRSRRRSSAKSAAAATRNLEGSLKSRESTIGLGPAARNSSNDDQNNVWLVSSRTTFCPLAPKPGPQRSGCSRPGHKIMQRAGRSVRATGAIKGAPQSANGRKAGRPGSRVPVHLADSLRRAHPHHGAFTEVIEVGDVRPHFADTDRFARRRAAGKISRKNAGCCPTTPCAA